MEYQTLTLQKEQYYNANFAAMTFTYFTTFSGATANNLFFNYKPNIPTTSGNGTVWARVENSNGCSGKINLVSIYNSIPSTFNRTMGTCDDYISRPKMILME
jgi:hypothetical protein